LKIINIGLPVAFVAAKNKERSRIIAYTNLKIVAIVAYLHVTI
jgi:hypothetical protein